jgi:RNA polymerase sigma factor (TIGR02999 family)
VTRLREAWSGGRREALDGLLPVVYGELRQMARGQLARARRQHTFQPTDLVHEALVRLVDQRAGFQNRVHCYGIAATCMRRGLADYARRRKAQERPQIEPGVEPDQVARGQAVKREWASATQALQTTLGGGA